MVYKGVSVDEVYPYVLEAERDLPIEEATVWHIRPQTVRTQNVEMAGYLAGKQKTIEARAAHATKIDRGSFLRFMARIERFHFYGEDEPRRVVEAEEDLIKAFNQIDPNALAELQNASRDPYLLREGLKKESPSSSGHPSSEKKVGEGGMTASPATAEERDRPENTA